MTEYNNIQTIYSIALKTHSVDLGHVSDGFMTTCSKKIINNGQIIFVVWDH